MNNIYRLVKSYGKVYVGFCNPKIFNVAESQLDMREQTKYLYDENHQYTKTKKEGNYTIVEDHRSIEWYRKVYEQAGFRICKEYFTHEYELKGNHIHDFIIFELIK